MNIFFLHTSIIIDTHTTQCFKLKVPFKEVKIYWDGKNKIYGLKNEVAIQATPFHYYVYVSKHILALIHDFELYKRNALQYLEYLLKTATKGTMIPINQAFRFWTILCD
jgi:hypothetical protein